MRNARLIAAMFLVATAIAGPAQAGTVYTWSDEAANSNWTDAGNWDGGEPTGTPSGTTDKAIIAVPISGVFPVVNTSPSIGELEIQANAELTLLDGRSITLNAEDPLVIGAGGDFFLKDATLVLKGGGKLDIAGTITLDDDPGCSTGCQAAPSIEFDVPTTTPKVFEIIPRSLSNVSIEAKVAAVIGDPDHRGATLVLGSNNTIRGLPTIEVILVNNGVVDANRAGELTLNCAEKSGRGTWRISHELAILKVDAPVTGGGCSLLEIVDGTLDLNCHWVSCGTIRMEFNVGKIEYAAGVLLQIGECGESVCGCEPILEP